MTCLGFDFGLKRIGVSVGNRSIGTARPLGTVDNRQGTPDWDTIDAWIDDWQPEILVVGLPLTADGDEQAITQHVRGFIKRLRSRSQREVVTCDERYSSIEASDIIRGQRASGQRTRRSTHADVDATAAALILERWFSEASS